MSGSGDIGERRDEKNVDQFKQKAVSRIKGERKKSVCVRGGGGVFTGRDRGKR